MTRRALPTRRASWRQKASIGGTTCYLTMGEYPDGTLGEIFVDVAKGGSAMRAVLDTFARTFSVALQNGAPLEELIRTNKGLEFQPNGDVIAGGSQVKRAKSIIDWIVREIENAYCKEEKDGDSSVAKCEGGSPNGQDGSRVD